MLNYTIQTELSLWGFGGLQSLIRLYACNMSRILNVLFSTNFSKVVIDKPFLLLECYSVKQCTSETLEICKYFNRVLLQNCQLRFNPLFKVTSLIEKKKN